MGFRRFSFGAPHHDEFFGAVYLGGTAVFADVSTGIGFYPVRLLSACDACAAMLLRERNQLVQGKSNRFHRLILKKGGE